MKAEDLRVGNYIGTIYPKFNYEKVKEIKEKVVYTDNIKGIGYISLKPIPLTEEILVKCGFKNEWSKYVYESNTLVHVRVRKDNFYVTANNVQLTQIKHLHQLQNLYYCLTGKELNIEL